MLTNKNPRQYEVQLWTLQDDFIAVLKGFNVDNFGTIEEPEMKLSDDSEDSFSFKLPMYIKENGVYKENPIWYNVTEGNLIANLRKIKVIFYKGSARQRIFEFVITKVTETHDGFEKTCEVECEGLAFNELGKTGYNISLSQELLEYEQEYGIKYTEILTAKNNVLNLSRQTTFIYDVTVQKIGEEEKHEVESINIFYNKDKYSAGINLKQIPFESSNTESDFYKVSYTYTPINNINYWLDKVLPPRFNWDYCINMNWSNYPDEARDSTRVYEDEYIENWEMKNEDDYKLYATNVVGSKEKFRVVTEEDSNRYNITQSIAETFGVYCRYIYSYDDNLHITGRTVEFYNNTLREDEEIVDFTYYYDTEDLSRSMDSADQISKMYVLSNNDDSELTNSIVTTSANKTLENYIINFDYMYETGAITDEQKEYIEEFEGKIRKINLEIQDLNDKITICENSLTTFKAKKASAEDGVHAATDGLDTESSYIRHLLNSDKTDYDGNPNTLSVTGLDPKCVVTYMEDGERICDINNEGVIPDSIKVFTSMEGANNYHNVMYDTARVKIEEINSGTDSQYYTATILNSSNTPLATASIPLNGGKTQFDTAEQAREAAALYINSHQNSYKTYLLDKKFYQVIIDENTGFATGLKIKVENVTYDNTVGLESPVKQVQDTNTLFLIYDYSPESYHKVLYEYFKKLKENNEAALSDYTKVVDKIDGKRDENDDWISDDHGLLGKYKDELEEKYKEKENLIIDFENYLGPAVREGNWPPEDDYAKYGDNRQISLTLEGDSTFNNETTSIGWDDRLFNGEEKNYYRAGLDEKDNKYYPCIKLTPSLCEAIAKKIQDSVANNDESADITPISITDIGFVWDDTVIPGMNKLIQNGEYNEAEVQEKRKAWEEEMEAAENSETSEPRTELDAAWQAYLDATRDLVKLDYPQIFRIGSQAEIAFLKKTDGTEDVIPVLMLIDADTYCSTYNVINKTGLNQTEILKELGGKIGILTTEEVPLVLNEDSGSVQAGDPETDWKDKYETGISYVVNLVSNEELQWIEHDDLKTYVRVYPRIQIPYMNFLQNDNYNKIIIKNDTQLAQQADYTIAARYDIDDNNSSDDSDNEGNDNENDNKVTDYNDLTYWLSNKELSEINYRYYITIKPEVIIRNNFSYGTYNLFYKLSNTALAIYLDAIEVLKENSIPKVEYDITPVILKSFFMENAYDRIHTIVHINDPELKFENVQGYISEMTLKLDEPWGDSFTVKNYTTKFEDLFSSIVASTESIQKNSAVISSVSQSFSTRGVLTEAALQKSISESNLVFKMSNDNFIIDDNGIKAYNENGGIVKYTRNGIFTANEKDSNGNWKWNTSILPSGISANAITTGQLNTNLIRIYSGNDLRFQMNSDGLFAYKSWLTEPQITAADQTIDDEVKKQAEIDIQVNGGLDPAQYVVMNSDGLFLTAKKGAYIIDDDNNAVQIDNDVDRVEVSWKGFILRNYKGEKTFYADPDTGNLNISGNIRITGKNENNISAELTENRLRFGPFELAQLNIENSETLSFVYYSEGSE